MADTAQTGQNATETGQNATERVAAILPLLLGFGSIGLGAYWQGYPSLQVGLLELFGLISPLVFFSLLIERTVEMLVSPWRSNQSYECLTAQQQARRVLEQARADLESCQVDADKPRLQGVVETALANFAKATSDRKRFQAMTLQWTFSLGWGLGMLLAAFGVRALSLFIEPSALAGDASTDRHLWWFNACDIVFTGALLAGGADPIHKLLDLYRKTVESTSDRATGVR